MGIGRLLYRALLPAALFLAAWQFVGWLILGAPVSRLFVFGLAAVAAAGGLIILSVNFWLRPDIRETKALAGRDALLVLVPWALWAAGAVVPDVPGLWVLAAAFLSMIVAGSLARRRLSTVIRERVGQAEPGAGAGASPFGLFTVIPGGVRGMRQPPVSPSDAGPDAGKIITIEPEDGSTR